MKADCVIFLFDLTEDYEETKKDMSRVVKEIEDRCSEDIIKLAVGTRADKYNERKAPHIRAIKKDYQEKYNFSRFDEIDATQPDDAQMIIESAMNEIKR